MRLEMKEWRGVSIDRRKALNDKKFIQESSLHNHVESSRVIEYHQVGADLCYLLSYCNYVTIQVGIVLLRVWSYSCIWLMLINGKNTNRNV